MGPVTLYGTLGGSRGSGPRRSPSVASYQRQVAAAARQQAAADKVQEARRLAQAFQALLSIHREEFPPAAPPVAPWSQLPEASEVRARHEHDALDGIGLFKRAERRAAKEQAAVTAQTELDAILARADQDRLAHQRELDALWAKLVANDPEVVIGTLAEAFEDNEAPAAPVAVDGGEVTLVVLAPAESVVPERAPGTTAAGNLSLRKLPKGERAALYTEVVMGYVLVTLREAFAVAPGLTAARVATIRRGDADAYGKPKFDCLLAGRWTRAAFEGVRWEQADAATVFEDTASDLVVNLRAGKELRPVDLRKEPGLAALMKHIDADEVLDPDGAAQLDDAH